MINKPRGSANAETENAEWQKFKTESDEQITGNEIRVGEFKQQAKKIKKNLKTAFDKKVSDLEQKNTSLKKKMKDYTDDRTDKQEKFKKEFTKSMKELA